MASIVDVDCVTHGGIINNCGVASLNNHGLFAQLYWSADEHSLFALGRDGLLHDVVIADPNSNKKVRLAGSASIGPPLVRDDLKILGTGGDNLDDEVRRLKLAISDANALKRSRDVRRARVSLYPNDRALLVQRDDLQAGLATDPTSAIRWSDVWWPALGERPFLVATADRKWLAAGEGLLKPFDRPKQEAAQVYAYPVLNSTTGLLEGRHSETGVYLTGRSSSDRKLEEKITETASALKASIFRVVIGPNRAAAIYRGVDGGAIYEVLWPERDGAWRSERLLCDAPAAALTSRQITVLGAGQFALPVRLYTRPRNRKLLVYARGGPTGALVFERAAPSIQRFLESGYDVLAPDYSGGVGASEAVAVRLRRLGGAAITSDAELTLRYLKSIAPRYAERVLYAESFGSTLGLALLDQSSSTFDAAVLVAPWLRYRDTADFSDRGGTRLAGSYQTLYERAQMGVGRGANSIDSWIETRPSRLRPSQSTLFIFGELDNKSKPDDLSTSSAAHFYTVPAAGHLDVLTDRDTWARADQWFRAHEPLPPNESK